MSEGDEKVLKTTLNGDEETSKREGKMLKGEEKALKIMEMH